MNETTGKGPIRRISDGSLVLKVWEQPGGENGRPFLTTTIERTYRDKETGDYRASHNLTRSQLAKLPTLAMEASQFIRAWEARQREQSRQQETQGQLPIPEGQAQAEPQGGLAAQRDQAFANATEPAQTVSSPDVAPAR